MQPPRSDVECHRLPASCLQAPRYSRGRAQGAGAPGSQSLLLSSRIVVEFLLNENRLWFASLKLAGRQMTFFFLQYQTRGFLSLFNLLADHLSQLGPRGPV